MIIEVTSPDAIEQVLNALRGFPVNGEAAPDQHFPALIAGASWNDEPWSEVLDGEIVSHPTLLEDGEERALHVEFESIDRRRTDWWLPVEWFSKLTILGMRGEMDEETGVYSVVKR